MIPSSVGPSSGQGGCLRELWSSISYPPYSEVVQFGDSHGNMMSSFFFGSYGAWGFPLHSYYLMAMWHVLWPRVMLGLVEGFLVPLKLFSFPMFF